jgi:hypothetical protein
MKVTIRSYIDWLTFNTNTNNINTKIHPAIFILKLIGIAGMASLLSFGESTALASAERCEFILDNLNKPGSLNPLLDYQAVHFKPDPRFNFDINKKSKIFNDALKRLLVMAADTVNESANEKLSVEKGEIYLGQKLPNGSSFEFRYVIDQRGDLRRFILDKITFYKKNMQEIKITDNPISEDMQSLNTNSIVLSKKKTEKDSKFTVVEKDTITELVEHYSEETDRPFLTSPGSYISDLDLQTVLKSKSGSNNGNPIGNTWPKTEINIPLVISGEILDVFIYKSELYQDLDRLTIRSSLQSGSLNKLNMLGYKSYVATKIKKIAVKQSIKGLIWQIPLFAFIYMLNQLHDIEKDLSNLIDPEPVLVSQEISDTLNQIFDRNDILQDWHNAKLYKQMKEEIKVSLSQNISSLVESTEKLVNWYILKEPDKSNIGFLRSNADMTQVTHTNADAMVEKQDPNSHLEHLFFYFPKQKALIIVTRTYSWIDPKQMTFESHVVVTAKKAPVLFNGLLNVLIPPPVTPVVPITPVVSAKKVN